MFYNVSNIIYMILLSCPFIFNSKITHSFITYLWKST